MAEASGSSASAPGNNTAPSTPKSKRPNYNIIHANPLPVVLYHAPPLIPHNPLSIIHHLYLFFFPPINSHKIIYTGMFSPVTMSVEVRDPKAVLDLWQKGFWGKGSLSRSEPTWLNREMRRLGDTRVGETSEEITRKRRDQRKEMKKERARKEKEELEKVKEAEADKNINGAATNGKPIVVDAKVVVDLEEELNGLDSAANQPGEPHKLSVPLGLPTPPLSVTDESDGLDLEAKTSTSKVEAGPVSDSEPSAPALQPAKVVRFDANTTSKEIPVEKHVNVKEQEHLQLTLCEAFFLTYAVGVLEITTQGSSEPLAVSKLLELFIRHSCFPPLPESSVSISALNPDNAFLINYAVYHHFRSLGWVVKLGVKFSVDYLLYKRGPVFTHAEFGVLIIPSYSRWGREENVGKEWHWLHSITRVNSQVKKTVLLVYVDVPTADDVKGWDTKHDGMKALLAEYRIREVALRRWIPGRNRD
ncbi:hypothetical protein H072_6205 [Dactylellina haptotyla CBS 200.50]|uniref:tRNA-splicing endonuclease subunit Sen2 n=1 Tax=Dactylellina haptotyla (strain CBS 200.50) TaxID=1284197 RepID=S8AA52_DACHA|nr:hypothetical protein H072_6205 [Dactylellina haptotyla CBS 200.50]